MSLLSCEKRVDLGYAFYWYGHSRLEWLMAYDWIYDGLSPGARDDLLNRYIPAMDFFMARNFTGVADESSTNVEYGNYGAGILRYYIPLVALDKPFITPETKTMLEDWLDEGYENYLRFT